MFNAELEKEKMIQGIKKFFELNGDKNTKAVIGISGGKDSTIVAALCVEAIGKERVIGVMMPNGYQADIDDSEKVISLLGIKGYTVDMSNSINELLIELVDEADIKITKQAEINIAPRIRMTTLYTIAQSLGGRVINTSNLSEYMVGYFTRWGDECGDYKPLINYTKTEVVEIGKLLDLPIELIEKTPSDGLTGKSDEDNFGFTYEQLDSYLRKEGKCFFLDAEIVNKIENKIKQTAFKRA